MDASLLAPERGERVPARTLVDELLAACASHARVLDCERELADVRSLAASPPAERQRALADGEERLEGLMERLSDAFVAASGGP